MKRWLVWLLVLVAVFVIGWYYLFYRGSAKKSNPQQTASSDTAAQTGPVPAKITWQTVERPQDGIKLDMPAGPKEFEVPSYNRNGSAEQVEMLSSSPDPNTTYAMAWQDNPPVARVNRDNPDRTLEAARDGMLERTQTFLITQSQTTVGGFPALDMTAKNVGGGILDARLIYARGRLYALIVTLPSLSARRQQDVDRFYNSFTPELTGAGTKPANANG